MSTDKNKKTELRIRVEEFVDRMGLNNSQFSVSIGCHPTYVGSIDENMKTETIKTINRIYPDLNIEWLLLGTGSMLKSDEGAVAVGDAANAQHGDGNTYHNGADAATIDRLIGEMSEQRKQLANVIDEMAEQRKQYSQQIDRLLTLLEHRP